MSLTFYCGSGSPYAWKVWLALEHKAIAYEFKLLSFDRGDTKSPEFRALNPRGKVPVIVDNGLALRESGVIVEYLEDRYPEKPLLPGDARARSLVRLLAAEAEAYLSPLVNRLFELTLYREGPARPEEIAETQGRILEELKPLEAQFAGPHLAGPLSLADITLFPHLRLLKRIEDRQPGSGISDDRLPPKLRGWMKRIEALPYYEKTIPPHWKT
jgi:glutathione S-transferase